jgi:hypothetical protein
LGERRVHTAGVRGFKSLRGHVAADTVRIVRTIELRLRWTNLWAAVLTAATGRHAYVSTSCLHGRHKHCRSAINIDGGTKDPGTCKHCKAVCRCPTCEHGQTGLPAL